MRKFCCSSCSNRDLRNLPVCFSHNIFNCIECIKRGSSSIITIESCPHYPRDYPIPIVKKATYPDRSNYYHPQGLRTQLVDNPYKKTFWEIHAKFHEERIELANKINQKSCFLLCCFSDMIARRWLFHKNPDYDYWLNNIGRNQDVWASKINPNYRRVG